MGTLQLRAESGDGQVAQEFMNAIYPCVVRALDENQQPFVGLPVTWSSTGGSTNLRNADAQTGADGRARVTFQASGVPAGLSCAPQLIVAQAGGQQVQFHATACLSRTQAGAQAAPPLTQLLVPDGTRDLGDVPAGTVLQDALEVLVGVQSGPQTGAVLEHVGLELVDPLDLSRPSPVATCTGGTVLTNAQGRAVCDVALNPTAQGPSRFVARVGGMTALEFTLNVTP